MLVNIKIGIKIPPDEAITILTAERVNACHARYYEKRVAYGVLENPSPSTEGVIMAQENV